MKLLFLQPNLIVAPLPRDARGATPAPGTDLVARARAMSTRMVRARAVRMRARARSQRLRRDARHVRAGRLIVVGR